MPPCLCGRTVAEPRKLWVLYFSLNEDVVEQHHAAEAGFGRVVTAVSPNRSLGERDHLDTSDPSQPLLYLAVILVEAVVLAALWLFSRSFGS